MLRLRAPKDTPARDAARTLTAGVIVAILILILLDPALRLYDRYVLKQPWATVEIELLPNGRAPEGPPDIFFTVEASRQLSGLVLSWVETPGGASLCRREAAAFGDAGEFERRWAWSAWFGPDCPAPDEPFRVCLRYVVETTAAAREVEGPFCSDEYVALAR
jgi:hypothetical protein